jgi:hypothetical protein
MADLLTHYVSARLPGGFIGDPSSRATFILGVFLPDLAGKGMSRVLQLPDGFSAPAHSALGLLVLTYAVALLFSAEFRARAWLTLYLGSLLHVGVDLLKDNLGQGSAFVLHPFSLEGQELALYFNENILMLIPGNLLLVLLIRSVAKRAQSRGWIWR